MFFMVRQFGGAVACDPDTWTIEAAPSQRAWQSVLYVPYLDRYVACANSGDSSKICYSAGGDGETWTAETVPTGANDPSEFVALACSDDTTVAVATDGNDHRTIRKTTSGSSWATDTSGSTGNQWRDVTYDSSTTSFIAVAQNNSNRCITSTDDGDTWTHRAIQANAWKGVHADHGTVIAVGDTGTISKSEDGGVTWADKSPGAGYTNNLTAVTYADTLGLWVAVANSGTGNRVLTSDDDGETWDAQTSASDRNWSDILWAEGVLVAVAENTLLVSNDQIQVSTDGTTWAHRTLSTASDTSEDWTGVTFGVDLFVVIGTASGMGPGELGQIQISAC